MSLLNRGGRRRRSLGSRSVGAVVTMLVMSSLLVGAPAAASSARQLHLTETGLEFTYFQCRSEPEDHCVADVLSQGKAKSNLSNEAGTVQYVLVVDFFNGWDDPCNRVDETATFAFPTGSIVIESHHVDCATKGFRIDTPYVVTGGTGRFSGAGGTGHEFGAAANPISVITYNGTITY